MSIVDCWGCRATPAHFCCSCVQQAITERHVLERAALAEKAELEKAMASGMAVRMRKLGQREARRAHRQLMGELTGELAEVRRDSDRLAGNVNLLRHAVRRSQQRLSLPTDTRPSPPSAEAEALAAATVDAAASVDTRLTACRASLVRELLHLLKDVWHDVSVDEQVEALTFGMQPASTLPPDTQQRGSSPLTRETKPAGARGPAAPTEAAVPTSPQPQAIAPLAGAEAPQVCARTEAGGGTPPVSRMDGQSGGSAGGSGGGGGSSGYLSALGGLSSRYLPTISAQFSQLSSGAKCGAEGVDSRGGGSDGSGASSSSRRGVSAASIAVEGSAEARSDRDEPRPSEGWSTASLASALGERLGDKLVLPSAAHLIPTQLLHSQISEIAHEIGLGAAPAASAEPGSPSNAASRHARDLGLITLGTLLTSRYLGLKLPYQACFEGSTSTVWHPAEGRALRLSPAEAPGSESHRARSFLVANLTYMLAHLPPTDPPASERSPLDGASAPSPIHDALASRSADPPGERAAASAIADSACVPPPLVGASSSGWSSGGGGSSSNSSDHGSNGGGIVGGGGLGAAALIDGLSELLTASSLAWELHARRSTLWSGDADAAVLEPVRGARAGERHEDWAVVDLGFEVPKPSMADEELDLYESTALSAARPAAGGGRHTPS